MDFEVSDSIQAERKKLILLTLNGNSDADIVRFKFYETQVRMSDIRTKVEHHFKMKIEYLRLYTQQGVEIFEEDLPYLKHGTLLYVSDKSDFDAYSLISVYQVIKVLGEGGFGKVMLGKHKVSGEQVAIKLIDSGKLWNAEDIDLVFREAEVMKNLRHNNIIKIYNCYTLPNMQVVLIMEFLQGGDLVEYIQEKGGLPEEEARVIFRQIAEAIRYCHEKRLIHRDLKLENILLTSKAEKIIKIIDFGIATVSTSFTIDKIDRGSLSYMPPEVMNGQAVEVKPSIDIWALGVILYALVCGNLPFTTKNQEQTIDNILKVNYSFPSNLILSKEYKELLCSILNPDQNTRYSIYEVLRHPWMQKVLTLSPSRTLNPRNKKVLPKKTTIKKEFTLAGPNRFIPAALLKGGATMIKSSALQSQVSIPTVYEFQIKTPQQYKMEEQSSPRSSLNFLGDYTNRSNIDQGDEILTPKVDNSPPPTATATARRKYSDFNQKLIDKIFSEDEKREKIQNWKKTHPAKSTNHRKSQSQCSPRDFSNFNSARTMTSSPLFQSRSALQTPNLYSLRSSAEPKLKRKSQVELQTIINLSQKLEWKQLFASPNNKSVQKNSKTEKMTQKQADQLYKLQIQFKHRKKNSDCLLQRQLITSSKDLTVKKLCNIIFSARVRAGNK